MTGKTKSDSVEIYTGNLTGLVNKGKVALTANTEKELIKLLEARRVIDVILDAFKEGIAEDMENNNINLIERGSIKITRSVNGRRFSLDPDKPVDAQFIQNVSYQMPNSKAVDKYLETEGSLPDGIIGNARKQKVDIELVED
jgi:hypothetical protein